MDDINYVFSFQVMESKKYRCISFLLFNLLSTNFRLWCIWHLPSLIFCSQVQLALSSIIKKIIILIFLQFYRSRNLFFLITAHVLYRSLYSNSQVALRMSYYRMVWCNLYLLLATFSMHSGHSISKEVKQRFQKCAPFLQRSHDLQ